MELVIPVFVSAVHVSYVVRLSTPFPTQPKRIETIFLGRITATDDDGDGVYESL